ncbi:MAG: Do family serine endopeptidase [Synergistaceae bacterium]|nr:Do family serine endopeptidase [Synergistaceae bacterium]
MKKVLSLTLTLALILVSVSTSMAAIPFAGSNNNPIVPIVKRASVAVVNIDVEKIAPRRQAGAFPFDDDPIFKHFFGDSFKEFTRSVPMKGRGSGFIVSKDGLILTNNHVVDNVDKITVSVLLPDGSKKTYSASIKGKDPTYDLAVIKIEPESDLQFLELGDSDKVEVGEFVVAIGNPYGFEQTVTAGVISAKNRSIHTQDVNFDDFIQTDAAINPGNSGGPLLNMDGKVIAINTAIIPYAQGMGFAVPVNKAKEIMDDLVSYGHARRGWLGVSVRDIDAQIAKVYGVKGTQGVMINDVFRGDPADKAGLKRGDVVIELNGVKIKNSNEFVQKVRTLAPNSTARLVIVRKGREMNFSVKLGERANSVDGRPDNSGKNNNNDNTLSNGRSERNSGDVLREYGISGVSSVNDSLRRRYDIESKSEGLVIIDMDQNSPAYYEAGVREGDLILEVNAQEVRTPSDAKRAAGNEESIILMIERRGSTYIIQVSRQNSK